MNHAGDHRRAIFVHPDDHLHRIDRLAVFVHPQARRRHIDHYIAAGGGQHPRTIDIGHQHCRLTAAGQRGLAQRGLAQLCSDRVEPRDIVDRHCERRRLGELLQRIGRRGHPRADPGVTIDHARKRRVQHVEIAQPRRRQQAFGGLGRGGVTGARADDLGFGFKRQRGAGGETVDRRRAQQGQQLVGRADIAQPQRRFVAAGVESIDQRPVRGHRERRRRGRQNRVRCHSRRRCSQQRGRCGDNQQLRNQCFSPSFKWLDDNSSIAPMFIIIAFRLNAAWIYVAFAQRLALSFDGHRGLASATARDGRTNGPNSASANRLNTG